MGYHEAEKHLGEDIVEQHEFRGVIMNKLLNDYGMEYRKRYAGAGWRPKKYPNGAIAYIYSSATYPYGHYIFEMAVHGWTHGLI
jgi:hypothetical protein